MSRSERVTREGLAALIFAAGFLCAVPGFAQDQSYAQRTQGTSNFDRPIADTKTHGDYMHDFEQYQLQLDEQNGWIKVKLIKKQRIAGGPVDLSPELLETEFSGLTDNETIRYLEPIDLCRVRSDVILPAAPNYVRNPGYRYRVMVEGITVGPDYSNVFDVDAANARAAVLNEAFKLYSLAPMYSPEQEAVYFGVLIGMRALNESGRLPAQIPLTVLRSKVGQFRIANATLGRRSVEPIDRFQDLHDHGLTPFEALRLDEFIFDPQDYTAPAYRRGFVESSSNPLPSVAFRYNQRENLQPPDRRQEQLRSIEEHKTERLQPRGGEPLTAPDDRFRHFGPLGQSQAETFELLTQRPLQTPAGARVEQLRGRQ